MKIVYVAFAAAILICVAFAIAHAAEAKDWNAEVKKIVAEHDVVLFGKSYCPYCKRAKQALTTANIKFHTVELDQVTGGPQMQSELLSITGQRTVPNVFVKGHHIGGSDAVSGALSDGRITDLLQGAHQDL